MFFNPLNFLPKTFKRQGILTISQSRLELTDFRNILTPLTDSIATAPAAASLFLRCSSEHASFRAAVPKHKTEPSNRPYWVKPCDLFGSSRLGVVDFNLVTQIKPGNEVHAALYQQFALLDSELRILQRLLKKSRKKELRQQKKDDEEDCARAHADRDFQQIQRTV